MNGHGAENGSKSSRDVLGLEVGSGPGKGRVGSQRCEDARVLKPSQMLAVRLRSFQLVTRLQKWKHPCRFIGHACYSSAGGLPRIILVEHLDRANEVAKGMVHIYQVRVGPSWMDPIVRFLKDDILPEEKSEAKKMVV